MTFRDLKIDRKLPETNEPLDGPPFKLLFTRSFLPKIRLIYYLILIYWVFTLLTQSTKSSINFQPVIGIILLLISLVFIQDKALYITGDHGNWNIYKFKYNEFFSIRMNSYHIQQIAIELRVIYSEKYKVSKVIIYDRDNKITDFMFSKKQAKQFQDYCDIINIPCKIRSKGNLQRWES